MRMKKGFRANKRIREPFGKRARRTFKKVSKPALAAIILAAVVISARMLYHRILTAPYLAINTINVTGGRRLSGAVIADLTGLRGKNILSFRESDVVARLRKNPWIEAAAIRRRFPAAIDVEVRERRPAALVKMDSMYVMDGGGVIFKKLSAGDNLDLPVITGLTMEGLAGGRAGWGLLELLNALANRAGFNLGDVSEIHFDPTFGFSVYTLEEGVRLDVGMDAFEEKLSRFEKVRKSRGGLRGVEAMDLNNIRQVVVRFATDIKEGGDAHGKKG